MSETNERKEAAIRVIEEMKRCSDAITALVTNSKSFLTSEENQDVKIKGGQFLGFLYLDVYVDCILEQFPELAGTLENRQHL